MSLEKAEIGDSATSRDAETYIDGSHDDMILDAESPDITRIFQNVHPSKIGIDRPLTPAKVNIDGSIQLTVYKSGRVRKRRARNVIQKSLSADSPQEDSSLFHEDLKFSEKSESHPNLVGESLFKPDLSEESLSKRDLLGESFSEADFSEEKIPKPDPFGESLSKRNLSRSNQMSPNNRIRSNAISKENQTHSTPLLNSHNRPDFLNESDSKATQTGVPNVRLRSNPRRAPRPKSLFVNSEPSKVTLSVSQSVDTNFFTSAKDPNSASSKNSIKTASSSRLDRLIQYDNVAFRRGSLPRMTKLYPSSPSDESVNDTSKSISLRNKKDPLKESEAKCNHRKSLPFGFAQKKRHSVTNFRMIKNVFNRSSSAAAELTPAGLPKQNCKTISNRRQSLPMKHSMHDYFRSGKKGMFSTSSPSISVSFSSSNRGRSFGWLLSKATNR